MATPNISQEDLEVVLCRFEPLDDRVAKAVRPYKGGKVSSSYIRDGWPNSPRNRHT
jgi:hypothetical protein